MNDYDLLFKQITLETTILTPNRRLSATLQKLYQEYQLSLGKKIWQTPDILPATSWIQRFFQDYVSKEFTQQPLLLNNAQEQFLWENIVNATAENLQLLQISETADLVKSAWNLLKQWKVDVNQPLFDSADDYLALKNWSLAFQQHCQNNNWLENASLTNYVTKKIQNNESKLPQQIILIGFTEVTPQLNYLLNACKEKDSQISHFELSKQSITCHRISLHESENEIHAMARWAKSIITVNPTVTIGCVIPTLDKIRDRVTQIFTTCFAEKNTCTIDNATSPFNISAGKSLSRYPIIHLALQLLALHKNQIFLEDFSYILTSPFIGDAEIEQLRRANFEGQLRQANINRINLASLLDSTSNKRIAIEKSCPLLAKRLQAFTNHILQQEKSLSYSEWAIIFNDLLTIMGWPGERSLNSEEYQIVESWLELLANFQTLDQVASPVSIHEALQMLYKLANKTLFQAKTPNAPIQVLGVLEAAGLAFDYLWIAGMDDLSWPAQPKPNPFIPKRLQHELQMPHATAERELKFCQILTEQFKQSAQHIIFSHAEKSDELELQASSLIRDLPLLKLEELLLNDYQSPCDIIYQHKQIENISDEIGPALTSDEKIRGGVNIIKQQALCPFKSFAESRLHAQPLETPLFGLRAKDRGTIVHKALELLWDKIKDQATLLALNESELNQHIRDAIHSALHITPNSRSEYKQYMQLEEKRLYKLMWDWLQIEKQRGPFRVITSEKAAEIKLNQLTLSIRIDRIDELHDGKKLIIDYKTGKNNEINSWFSERPDEPQLPLYSLLDPDNTTAITFAQIVSGEPCFKGISDYALELKGVRLVSELKSITVQSWHEQIKAWNDVLLKLSDDFYQGIATVDPKDPAETCTWCELKPFCRINEELTI